MNRAERRASKSKKSGRYRGLTKTSSTSSYLSDKSGASKIKKAKN